MRLTAVFLDDRDARTARRLRALDCLAQIHASTGEDALALRAAEEALSSNPFREAGHRRLMLIQEAACNRAEVVRICWRMVALLAAELETAPGHVTHRLARRLRGERDEADDDADEGGGSRDRSGGRQRSAAPRADVHRGRQSHRD